MLHISSIIHNNYNILSFTERLVEHLPDQHVETVESKKLVFKKIVKELVVDYVHQIWEDEKVPEQWCESKISAICKKKGRR